MKCDICGKGTENSIVKVSPGEGYQWICGNCKNKRKPDSSATDPTHRSGDSTWFIWTKNEDE